MSKATKLPGLKNIPASTEPELRGSLQAMKEALAVRLGQEGDPLDRAITLRELVDSGMAKKLTNKKFDPNTTTTDFVGSTDDPVNLSTPPAPISLEASGAFTTIVISWAPPAYGGHSFTEVFRSRDDAIGTAQLVTTTEAAITTDEVGYNQEYYYWVRFVNISGVRGPFNQTNGVKATTSQDIAEVLTQLNETLADLPGYSTLTGLISAGTLVIRAASAPSTRTDGSSLQLDDIWLDTDDDQLYVRNSSNNAWVKARDGTIKADIDTLVASLNSSNSRSDSTIAAAIAAERVVRVTAEGANATSISNLTSTVNGVSSSVTTVQNAVTNGTSSQAGYGISVNADGAIAGMYIMADTSNNLQNNTSSTNIIFEADQFAIRSSSASTVNADGGSGNKYTPFIVRTTAGTVNGLAVPAGVYIKDGWIQEGSITNAKIANATIEAAKIVSLDADVINAGTVDAQYLDAAVIVSTDLSNNTSTVIHGGNISTGTVSADRIDTAILRATDVGSGGSTVIDGGRIDTGTIDADRISTTDLVLPSSGGLVSGSSIGNFNNNSKRYAEITTVGTGAGLYQGYVRLVGGTGQVKTIHLLFSDGTVDTTVTSGGSDTAELLDSSSGVVYRTPDIEHLNTSITQSRLISSADTANIPIVFRYTGSSAVKCYIYGQGDGGVRQIGSADVRFVKFSAS